MRADVQWIETCSAFYHQKAWLERAEEGEEDKRIRRRVLVGWEEDRLDGGRVPRERRGRSRPRENGVGVWRFGWTVDKTGRDCGWSFLMRENVEVIDV